MTWITTHTGRDHYLGLHAAFLPGNEPRIDEIAHALALINRFTGHTSRPYSVAEHSVLVCDIAAGMGLDAHGQMAALMHDAHEAYCGDVPTPIKDLLGKAWMEVEHPQAALVRNHFALRAAHTAHRAAIKHADLIALATERRDLLPSAAQATPWPVLDTPGAQVHPLRLSLEHSQQPWQHWRDAFLLTFHRLDAQRQATPAPTTAEADA